MSEILSQMYVCLHVKVTVIFVGF